jgi:transposase-like protein
MSYRPFTANLYSRNEVGVSTSIAAVARAFAVNPNLLHGWRREFRHGSGNAFPGASKRRWDEGRMTQLERQIGQQTVEIDFLKGCWQSTEEQRMLQAWPGKPRSLPQMAEQGQGIGGDDGSLRY